MREGQDGGPQRSPSLLLYIAVQESMWFQTFEDDDDDDDDVF